MSKMLYMEEYVDSGFKRQNVRAAAKQVHGEAKERGFNDWYDWQKDCEGPNFEVRYSDTEACKILLKITKKYRGKYKLHETNS